MILQEANNVLLELAWSCILKGDSFYRSKGPCNNEILRIFNDFFSGILSEGATSLGAWRLSHFVEMKDICISQASAKTHCTPPLSTHSSHTDMDSTQLNSLVEMANGDILTLGPQQLLSPEPINFVSLPFLHLMLCLKLLIIPWGINPFLYLITWPNLPEWSHLHPHEPEALMNLAWPIPKNLGNPVMYPVGQLEWNNPKQPTIQLDALDMGPLVPSGFSYPSLPRMDETLGAGPRYINCYQHVHTKFTLGARLVLSCL